jgi:hypothetical protein
MKTSILNQSQNARFRAIELVFEYYCMIVDANTDPIDEKRLTIVAIHQAENHAKLIDDLELLTEIQILEARWFRGEL